MNFGSVCGDFSTLATVALWQAVPLRGSSVPPEAVPSSDGRAALHWSYPSAWPPAPTATPPTLRSGPFKRTRSMTDDCDDDYSEESSKEQ